MHINFNHMLSNKNIDNEEINEEPTHMKDDLRWTESISNGRLSKYYWRSRQKMMNKMK